MTRQASKLIRIGQYEFDTDRTRLYRRSEHIPLTEAAGRLLEALAANRGRYQSLSALAATASLDSGQLEAAMDELGSHLRRSITVDQEGGEARLEPDNSVYGWLEELRSRNVFRVATGYAVGGWFLLQLAEIVLPIIGIEQYMRGLLIAIMVGFPVAVCLAWALELTPAGIEWDWHRSRPRHKPVLDETTIDRFIIAMLVMVIAVLIFRMFVYSESPQQFRVVAVLPFAMVSSDGADSSLCEGFAEEIRVGLDRLPGIRVASRRLSVRLAAGTGDDEVGWLVEGSCRMISDLVDVTVSLTDARSGLQQWAYSDSRSLEQLLRFQDDIAAALAFELAVPGEALQATTEAETANPRAYRFYLQARGYLSRPRQLGSLKTAAELFKAAIEEDAEYAAAHAGLCEADLARYLRTHEQAVQREAESACLRASQLGPGLPEVHIALGRLFLETGDHRAAERALRRALKLKPGNIAATTHLARVLAARNMPAPAEALFREAIAAPAGSWNAHGAYGKFLLKRGRLEDAAVQYEEVVALTPDNASAYNNLGATYLQMGRLEDAARNFSRAVEIAPVTSSISNYGTMLYYIGEFEQAEAQFRKAATLSPADHRLRGNVADAVYQIDGRRADALAEYERAAGLARQRLDISKKDAQAMAALAWYLVRMGRTEPSDTQIGDALSLAPQDPEVSYFAALVHLEAGDPDLALKFLLEAARLGYPLFLLEASPDVHSLTETPAFESGVGPR